MNCHVHIQIMDGSLCGKDIDFNLIMDHTAMIFGRNLDLLSDDTVFLYFYFDSF